MPKSLATVARTGDRLKTLEALRDYLAEALDETVSARDQASLSARLIEVTAAIADLKPPEKEADPLASLIPD